MSSPKTLNPELVRNQLGKILSSPGFARNDRLSGLLRFVVERELLGRADELKESVIGVEFFGRQTDYDVRQDSIVRNEAAKLRSRLAEYYVGEGVADELIIDLPKGGYKPAFRQTEKLPAFTPRPETSWRFSRIWLAVALAACVAASGLWWDVPRHRKTPIAIAVLPLINLDRNPDHDYYADGLTGEIIRNLSIIDGLAVRSQTSSFAFKGQPQNAHDVGKQLNVEYLLEGSVLLSGRQLRINAQLVRVRDDFPLWAGKYDRELTDVFAVQEEISRAIVNELRLNLGRGRRRYESSVEAYDLYLHARALQVQERFGPSIQFLEEAIAKDSSFAPAYAALSTSHALRSGEFTMDIAHELEELRAVVEQAIRLDPLLPESQCALGMLYARDAQWAESEKSFRRAIELDPDNSAAHTRFAEFLLRPLGRIEEALSQLRIARKNDPLSVHIESDLGWVLVSAGRYDEAVSHCSKLPEDYPGKSLCLGNALLFRGRTAEAIQVLIQSHHAADRAYLGYAYARSGHRDEAEKLALELPPSPLQQAVIFAGLGDKERTLEALDRMAVVGPVRMGWILGRPELALLRGDPRLNALRKKLGLPR